MNLPFIKKLAFTPYNLNYYADMGNTMISRMIRFSPFGFITNADDEFSIFIQRQYEYHDDILAYTEAMSQHRLAEESRRIDSFG